MRAQFSIATIGVIGIASIALAAACSSSSDTGTGAGANSGGTSSSGSSSGSASGSGSSSGSTSGGGSSSGSGSTSGGSSGSGGGTASGSGSGSSGGADGGAPPSGDGGVATFPYPSGPYCANAGSGGAMATGCMIPNLSWNGYVDDTADALATTKPYVAYSLLDVYNAAKVSGKKYLMINIAEFSVRGASRAPRRWGWRRTAAPRSTRPAAS